MGKPTRETLKLNILSRQPALSGLDLSAPNLSGAPLVGTDLQSVEIRPQVGRREFLGIGARTVAFLAAFQAVGNQDADAAVDFEPFTYGVASGDPLPTRLIIWTRVNPSAEATPGSGLGGSVRGKWQVAEDAGFTKIVRSGTYVTNSFVDHTVKVDVFGLRPDTEYYYRFSAFRVYSPVGRGKTAPRESADVAAVRFGMVSCSNFEAGYFTPYRFLARRDDLDFVLHLGDYLYEYGAGEYGPEGFAGEIRKHDPITEIVSLADYRRRHACYKADPDLRKLHARYTFVTTWDDHETANDSWENGAQNHTPETEGPWKARQRRASRAYFEWMPIRPSERPTREGESRRIYRSFQFGNLVELYMLDLRQYRSQQPPSPVDSEIINDPARTILGDAQMTWLANRLSASSTNWRLLGNSVMMAPVTLVPSLVPAQLQALLAVFGLSSSIDTTVPINVDSWDGYNADRTELLSLIANPAAPINNVVFLTGDIHSSWACDLPANPATYPVANNSIATEFVCTSVTSDNVNELIGAPERIETAPGTYVRNPATPAVEQLLQTFNPWVRTLEMDSHGFCVVDVNTDRVQVDYWFIRSEKNPADSRIDKSPVLEFYGGFQTVGGTNQVTPAPGQLG